jgi:hypothetical protein
LYGNVHVEDTQTLWVHEFKVHVGANHTNPLGLPSLGDLYLSDNSSYCIRFIRQSSTVAVVEYYQMPDFNPESGSDLAWLEDVSGWIQLMNETVSVDSSVWTNPIVNLYTGHWGHGRFTVICEAVVNSGEMVALQDLYWDSEDYGLYEYFSTLTGAIGSLFSVLEPYTVVFNAFVPVIPIFLVLYVIDLGVTCARTGNLKLIGDFFSYGFGMMLKIWGLLVDMFDFIREVIMFWK